jgi:hypothetical protein
MTKWYWGNNTFSGTSKDEKPSYLGKTEDYEARPRYWEVDTKTLWKWNGERWYKVRKKRVRKGEVQ